jgi:hypothetical protein
MLAIASCRIEEEAGDKLNPDEINSLRNRATAQCIGDSAEKVTSFKEATANQFDSSASNRLYRGKTWKILKKAGSSNDSSAPTAATVSTSYLTVWKHTTEFAYLLFNDTSGTDEKYKFIKVDLTNNDAMVDALQTLFCSESDIYAMTLSASVITYKSEVIAPFNDDLREKRLLNYQYEAGEFVFLGTFRTSYTVQKIDFDDKVKSSTIRKDEISLMSDTDTEKPTLKLEYTLYDASRREYCLVADTTQPFEPSCSALAPVGFDPDELQDPFEP